MFRLSSSSASSSASASSSSSGKAINRRISIIIDIIIIIIIVFPRWWCGMNEFRPHFQIWASASAAATTTETGDSKSIPFKSIAGIAKFRETQSAKTTWFLMTNERHGRWMVAPESRLDPVAGQMLLTGLRDDARSQVLADQSGDTFWSDQSRFIDHVIVFQIPNVYNGSLSGTMMYVDTYDGRPPQNRSTRLRWLTRDCGMQNTLGGDTMVAPLSSYDTYVNSDKPFEVWIVNHLPTETGTRMTLTQNSVAFSISADNRVMNIKRFHRTDSIFYTLCEYDDEKISFARNSTACESGGQALDWPIYTGFVANRMWMLFGSDSVYLFDQALIENGQIGKYRYRNFVDFFFNPGFITASTATFRPSTSSISNSSAVTPYSPNRNNTTATGPNSASEIGAHSLEIIIATVVIIITIAILCGLWMAFGRHFGSQQQPQQQPLEDGAGPALGPDQAPAPQEDNNENVTNEAIEVENGGEAGEEANPDDEQQQQQQQQEDEEPPQPEQQGASGSTSAAAAGSASVKTATKKVKQNLPRSPRNTLKALQDILARKSRLNPTLKAGGATGRSSKKAKKSAQMANGDRNGSGDPKPAHSGLSNPSEVLPPSLDRVPESLVRSIKTENCSKSKKKSQKPPATTTTGSKKLIAQQMPRSPSRKNSSSKSEAVAAGGAAHGKKSTKISRKMNQKLSKKRSKASARSSTTTSATSTAATSKPSSARKAKSVKANVKSKPKSIIPLNKTSKKSKKSTKFSNNNNKSIQNKTKMKLKSSKNHQQPPHQVDVNNKQKSGKPKPKSKSKSRSKPKPNSKPKSISKPKPKTIKNSNKQQHQQAKSSRKKGTKSSKR